MKPNNQETIKRETETFAQTSKWLRNHSELNCICLYPRHGCALQILDMLSYFFRKTAVLIETEACGCVLLYYVIDVSASYVKCAPGSSTCKGTLYNMPPNSTIHLQSLRYAFKAHDTLLKLANSLWTLWNLFAPCRAYSAPSPASCLHSTVGPHCLTCLHWSTVCVSLM